MSSLAEIALQHARARLAGGNVTARTRKQPTAGVAQPMPTKQPVSTEVVVTGPINHFMLLEGRKWAVDLVASLRATPVALVIERLAGATTGRPGSYAAGIQSVIKELRAPDTAACRDEENLTHQVE